MNIDELKKIIDEDVFGILAVKKPISPSTASDQRLLNSFLKINDFIDENGRLPDNNKDDIQEYMLFERLKKLRLNCTKSDFLKTHDVYEILEYQKDIQSLDDILNDDLLGILDDAVDLFQFKHTPKIMNMPDYIAKRKPCRDFTEYEQIFKQCHIDLKSTVRKIRPFAYAQQIHKGHFFVLKGVLLYISEIITQETTVDGRVNPRLHCIFENGTEIDILQRSLAAELYKDGKRITESINEHPTIFAQINNCDAETGYIYVAKSKSENPQITPYKNLYKIGFSKVEPHIRLKNCDSDPTFLMANAALVSTYKCYNLNPQKLEQFLHTFFGSACLDIDVILPPHNKRYSPREWFVVPIDIIDQAINLLIAGTISNFIYEKETQQILRK